jgi:integrase
MQIPETELGTANPLFVSSILTRASNSVKRCNLKNRSKKLKDICNLDLLIIGYGTMRIPVTITDHGKYISLAFEYKNEYFKHRLYSSIFETSCKDISDFVTKKCNEIDGAGSILNLINDYLEFGTGASSTKKKNVGHLKNYCKRDGIELGESITRLAQADEFNRTLPERWAAKWDLPHKMRQVRSIFNRKNIVLYRSRGWDTDQFRDFISFIPETCVSQPFSTDDAEVERIIKFFNDRKESHPVFHDIYTLAFGAGLRKSEIYQVRFEHFTTFNGQHFLQLPFATKRTKLKKVNHIEKVGISKQTYDHFKNRSSEGLVINGGERLHRRFIKFLKNDLGITENKACHRLRKILGARLASTAGIYHAAKTLRNSVVVAEKYYSDLTAHRNELEI